ncbi:MAG: 7-cyano-7-deazaguanine synthase QueC [Acidobacteriota bacterium]|nr:7-cyano-7-deazaguanine synthase QueC [Acidobacteriota bacterium]
MDSTVLLYHLRSQEYDVRALSVDYGQRHRKELGSARTICRMIGIPHEVADLRGIAHLLKGSSLTDSEIDVPEGHYAEESMKVTVVPNRNMIMLSVAIGYAISLGSNFVAYGAHAGDHVIYPDCRPEFASAVNTAALLADWHQVELLRPFIRLTKAEIAKRGAELNVPFDQTWSCYKGGERHCGRCGTCVERAEAFLLAGIDDPTDYEVARAPQEV